MVVAVVVAEQHASVQRAVGDPDQVQRGGAVPAQSLRPSGEFVVHGGAQHVAQAFVGTAAVVAEPDQGLVEDVGRGGADRVTVAVGTVAAGRPVAVAEEWQRGDAEDRPVLVDQAERDGAQRVGVLVIDRAVDGIEYPVGVRVADRAGLFPHEPDLVVASGT
ncbi:hypothetical protein GCM10011609_86120 [Lentzea pudingi]|uniref:Uncharacterized protein n=1 Tax=Lentzea pudingi TaxID=1789439 RepID=A0ABQ2IVY0_9PSEU|nr:hypothetical protein GCM10011609_86120 [Lentzea pudingi]